MKKDADTYKGYNGNEAVVSPVTGILLEYGTYTDEDIDSITGNGYRENVDIKYGFSMEGIGTADEQETEREETEEQQTEEFEEKIVSDKVGYAKILVLDTENYLKMEETAYKYSNRTLYDNWGEKSLVNENGNFRNNILIDDSNSTAEEKLNGRKKEDGSIDTSMMWTELQQTIYGYKQFADNYKTAGIDGYIVYIDGFVCELPDENLEYDEKTLPKQIPEGARNRLCRDE